LPCNISDLSRGAVCLALYPFVLSFPVERVAREAEDRLLAHLKRFDTIDDLQIEIPAGDPGQELVASFKLRPILVLHDGTDAGIPDVAVAKVTSIKADRVENHPKWYKRVQEGRHDTQYMLERGALTLADSDLGSYVDAKSVAVVRKTTILRRVGKLDRDQMVEVSNRLIKALEIDVSEYVISLQPPPADTV
jgi:hypothetical protein